MGERERKKVRLVPGSLRLMQKTNMAIFVLTHCDLVYRNEQNPEDGIELVLRMRRKVTTEVMTTYLPTTLLLLIAYSTTFFEPCFFEAALSVNLTTMLVMTTIFISKMESLPPTSDIKMVDIWLILCQMVPFAEVILLTAMEYNREDEKKEKRTKKKGKRKTKNSGIAFLTVIPIDGNELVAETKVEDLYSKCTFPSLKTLGELDTLILLKTVLLYLQRERCYL